MHLPKLPQVLFDPSVHMEGVTFPPPREQVTITEGIDHTHVLPLYLAARQHTSLQLIPRQEECEALWEKYHMFDHIRLHSTRVAEFAVALAECANANGQHVNKETLWAAGLLHDLGKTYCIQHKGNHAQMGAGWTMQETRNGLIAQAVLMHVQWPWEEKVPQQLAHDDDFLVIALLYADKRVKHDEFVSLEDRFTDLLDRYGKTEQSRQYIQRSHEQGMRIEQALSQHLGVPLHEYTFDSGRLVVRA